MAKRAILAISLILVSSLFLGCIDTDNRYIHCQRTGTGGVEPVFGLH